MARYNECKTPYFLDNEEARTDWWNNVIGIDWRTIFTQVIPHNIQTERSDFFKAIRELQELNLLRVNITSIEPIKLLRKLETLIITECPVLENLVINAKIGLVNLKELRVINCQQLPTMQITSLEHLNVVNFSGLVGLTQLDLSGCKALTTLDLSRCTNLTTLDLSGCTSLTTLNLTNCGRISDNDLFAILAPFLQHPSKDPSRSQLTELQCEGTQIADALKHQFIAKRCNVEG